MRFINSRSILREQFIAFEASLLTNAKGALSLLTRGTERGVEIERDMMNTLQAAIRLTVEPAAGGSSAPESESEFRIAQRIEDALSELLNAFDYAQDLNRSA